MKDIKAEIEARVDFIRKLLESSGAEGIVYGNSGGKDSALVGILCKMATDNVLGVIMPCGTSRNFKEDKEDAIKVAGKFGIDYTVVDITPARDALAECIGKSLPLGDMAKVNIPPRLRMTVLYSIARTRNYLVAGTGNRSEGYMGYFTKWGDGAFDFNPISDLTVTEEYEILKYLGAPECIITKAPSAGLYEGQTDEGEMGITYAEIDRYLLHGEATEKIREKIERSHAATEHKRAAPIHFKKI